MLRTLLSLLLAFPFLHTVVHAQGWVGKYSPERMMGINGIQERTDGSYLITGSNLDETQSTRLMMIGANGQVLGAIDHDSLHAFTATARTLDGGFAILGTRGSTDQNIHIRALLLVDGDGQRTGLVNIDTATIGPNAIGNLSVQRAPNGDFICATNPNDISSGQQLVRITRVAANGDRLWQRDYYESQPGTFAYEVLALPDGGAVVSLGGNTGSGDRLMRIDAEGDVLWTHAPTEALFFMVPTLAADGSILVNCFALGQSPTIKGFDPDGNELWSQTYPALEHGMSFDQLLEEEPGIFVGIGLKHINDLTRMSLVRLNAAGEILLQRPLPLANLGLGLHNLFTRQGTLTRTLDGGYIMGGWIEMNPAFPHTGFLIKMDAEGNVYPGLLSGYTYADLDNDCVKDANEPVLNGSVLSFTQGNSTHNAATTQGFFMLGLDNGPYAVHGTTPSPYWHYAACNPGTVQLPASGDTVVAFAFQPLVTAPYFVIDAHARRRQCMANTYTLQYCNTGTAPFSGILQVDFDGDVTVDSSSTPWANQTGNYVIHVENNLGIGECRSIDIHYTASCDLELMGRSLCIETRALPNMMYLPGPDWDGSDLAISAEEDADAENVVFTVRNNGSAMNSARPLVIHTDSVELAPIPVQLDAGATYVHTVPANGSTWRGTIAQTPGNPASAFVTVALEGAGTNSDGGISVGFVDDFPLYGEYAFRHLSCGPLANSYDPNRKTVSPEGVGAQRYVDSTATLNYTLEFQNTGNDVAYVVRLVDTLTTHLDPTTVVPGAASHPYTWRFLDHNVLEFLFENINLLDSTTNEAESHGFVRFSVKQRSGNSEGTTIANTVGIYFDHNPPVITDPATVTVGWPQATVIVSPGDPQRQLLAYPNPFTESTTIHVGGVTRGALTLLVYDATGRMVKHQRAHHSDRFVLERGSLYSGTYSFRISDQDGVIGNGRVIVP